MRTKKGQQEILGFVIIVVIVVIIGVIFLGISLRKNSSEGISTEDAEIANFLSISTKYTTDCVLKKANYAEIVDVLNGCYNGQVCLGDNDASACVVLEESYKEMVNTAFPSGAERPIKYTKLEVYYQADVENPNSKTMLVEPIESGDSSICSTNRAGKYIRYKYPGNLVIELSICK